MKNLSKEQYKKELIEEICNELLSGNNYILRKLGKFVNIPVQGKTNKAFGFIPAHTVVKFRLSEQMKRKLRKNRGLSI